MKILKILLYNNKSEIIEMKYIKELKISEDYIIEQCRLRYSTDEPCIIYRTLVMSTVHIMLDSYFRNIMKNKGDKIEINKLPNDIIHAIDFPENTMFLEVSL